MTIMNELRQYVSRRLVAGRLFLAVLELLPQVLGLMLELLCNLFFHCCCHTIFEDLGLPATPFCTNLQEVGRNTLLSYRSQSDTEGGLVGHHQPSSQ